MTLVDLELGNNAMAAAEPLAPPRPKRTVGFDATAAANFADATTLTIISVDSRGNIRFVNRAAANLFGYEREAMIGRPVEIIIPERLRSAHARGFARAMAGAELNLGGKAVEVYAIRKDGSEFPIELTLCAWHDGVEMGAGAVIEDISERRERESRLLRLASQDTLTGLHNRGRFVEFLKETVPHRSAMVLMIDIDGFQDVNDTHGHTTGDSLLQSIAVRLRHRLPPAAQVARFGNDEFAVFVQNTCEQKAVESLAGIVMTAFSMPFEVNEQLLDVSVSVGGAIYPRDGDDADELLANADLALTKAKSMGGRSFQVYEPAMRSEAGARRAMRDELRLALRAGQLALHYQPQVNIETGTIFGVEALIRWQHPEKGLLLPGAFLPALEQSALALEIGWWTLDEACRTAALMNALSPQQIKMGVNLFPAQLRAPYLGRKVSEALEKYRLEANLLEIEVTETIALTDDDRSLEAMNTLRDIGVGIAFDDFGTGYASLSSLQRYPLTTLKIDRGFVSELSTKPRDAAITRAMIRMSLEMGIETIAEGIENSEQEAFLLSLGCSAAQGYKYGRPMPFEALANILSKP
ncbi:MULTISPECIES: putative bifunctional diguanylate cyclase/phosphodiesterase [unclassified Rhizobium]|uniref:putative bifunctional diguanylate cyclase/phosphodiesterase n=1 Tax=unclassified Rhizobium TaxID=2613769 RepID=UPI001ADD417D|nr:MULTISPECIES: GGDEF domain-containing phosphodiesterase [unclassified Rhizobium]MBO9127024.1 EAL domain-containing protein [Rhizobium sp. 16-488-2b]MBO9177471.1 EAL domain-containing protein [Rhizobium sp. 16-488-2a]